MKCFERVDEDNSLIYPMFISVLCLRACLHEVTCLCLFSQFLPTQITLSRSSKNFNVTETQLFDSESILIDVS
jgi:hypothetical protein